MSESEEGSGIIGSLISDRVSEDLGLSARIPRSPDISVLVGSVGGQGMGAVSFTDPSCEEGEEVLVSSRGRSAS